VSKWVKMRGVECDSGMGYSVNGERSKQI
jgi:hypothetical protein